MKKFHTVVLERLKDFSGSFETEPYEAGWASEAIFFIRVHACSGVQPHLHSFVQISPDGIHWVDEGIQFPEITTQGDYFVKVAHFGGWLRLRNAIAGQDAEMRLTIHLVLKE